MALVVRIDSTKWLFAAVASAISFLVGRKFAFLQQQYNSCDTTIKDHFITNILTTANHLRHPLQLPHSPTVEAFTKEEVDRAGSSSYVFFNYKENSALTSVFSSLHHPGYPSEGEFILAQENYWNDDFSTCSTVYATRSGSRIDESQPTTCVGVVRVPSDGGYHSPQSLSHRNGSVVFPQILTSQYQDDFLKDYTMERQHLWVQSFMQHRDKLVESFLKEVGSPFDEANPSDRRTIIAMVANEGVLDFLLNFICSARAASIKIEDVVVFLGQEDYIDLVHSMGAKAFYHPSMGEVPRHAAESYADRTFTKLMWMKMTSFYVAMNSGFNVIFQDTDLVWIKNPVSYFKSMPYDMAFMDDGARTMRFGPLFTNTGFYFIRHTPKALYLMERLVRSAGEIDYTASHQATFIRHLVETTFLFGVQILILDERDFPSGQMYHHQKEYLEQVKKHRVIPYVWHMCWTDNREQKITYLKNIGMWYLQPTSFNNGMCEVGQDMLSWLKENENESILTPCCITGDYWKYEKN